MAIKYTILSVAFFLQANIAQSTMLPFDYFPTKDSLFLAGTPKQVIEKKTTTDNYDEIKESIFDENGLLIRSTGPRKSMEVIKRNGKIAKLYHYTGANFDKGNATIITPQRYDDDHQITYLTIQHVATNGTTTRKSPPGIIHIRYQNNLQVHQVFSRQGDSFVGGLVTKFEFSDDGRLVKSCWHGETDMPCDETSTIYSNYAPNEPLLRHTEQSKTTFDYKDNQLVTETGNINAGSGTLSRIVYSNYVVDDCGNWISRDITSHIGEQHKNYNNVRTIDYSRETRAIEYYSPCKREE